MRDWNRKRWNWKRAVKKDPRLSDAAKLLAVSLCDDFAHHETARCTPHVGTLAECLSKSDRSIQRALAELRRHRWIDVKHRRGRGARTEIFFENGDGTVPISSPEKVTELASYKTEKATVMSEKHDNRVTPYIEPNNNQTTRECAGEGPADQDRPCQAGVDPTALAPPPASRPAPHLSVFVQGGTPAEDDWNRWLARHGLPTLPTFAPVIRHDGVEGFDLPFRCPPHDPSSTQHMIAQRFVSWRKAQTDARYRRNSGTFASHSAVG